MKFYILIGVVLSAAVGIVISTSCHGHDTSQCGMNCTNAGETVGCERDTCTCVKDGGDAHGKACSDAPECHDMHCDPHKEKHCVDKHCTCLDAHHHP